jgi:hypothetical protein
MTAIAKKTATFLRSLIEAGVLQELKKDRLACLCQNGILVFKCGDGDQSFDYLSRKREVIANNRLHIVSVNGGALNLPIDSPLVEGTGVTQFLLKQITTARELKSIDSVSLSVHFPCGAARLAGLSDQEVIQCLFSAKELLVSQKGVPREFVHPTVHVDWGDDTKSLLFAKKTQWEDYCKKEGINPYFRREAEATA